MLYLPKGETLNMYIDKFILGPVMTNCYIVSQDDSAVVIDPGAESQAVLDYLTYNHLILKGILLTHGHFDHIGGVVYLQKHTGAKTYIHQQDEEMCEDTNKNGSTYFGIQTPAVTHIDGYLEEGKSYDWDGMAFHVLHTPGHSKGGVCLLSGNALFSGDTLFKGGIGRTDLYGGNYDQLIHSIQQKLLPLDKNYDIYPGHGNSSTLILEKQQNPYL